MTKPSTHTEAQFFSCRRGAALIKFGGSGGGGGSGGNFDGKDCDNIMKFVVAALVILWW